MFKKLISSILSLIITLSVFAKEEADSVSSHIIVPKSWFVVPIGFYQEETSVGLGVTGGYYFKSNSLDRIMDGALDDLINALVQEDQKRKLQGETSE